MKLSSNSIGILIFTVLAAAIFFFMAKRPAVEGNALNFGMPMPVQTSSTSSATDEVAPVKVEEASTSEVTDNTEPKTVESKEAKSEEVRTESVENTETVKDTVPTTEQEPKTTEETSATPATEAPATD